MRENKTLIAPLFENCFEKDAITATKRFTLLLE